MPVPENIEKTITCAKCGHKIAQSLAWFHDNPKFACPSCGVNHFVEGAGGLIATHKKVQDMTKQFQESIRRRSREGSAHIDRRIATRSSEERLAASFSVYPTLDFASLCR